jgi:hypothetical protein
MRLITRADFDGLICAVLLRRAGVIDGHLFVHPKDVQDGKVEVGGNDVLANVPYAPGCGLWFDHHMSEEERGAFPVGFKGATAPEKSCARVIYNHYGGAGAFPGLEGMMAAVDKSDSGDLTIDEIENPGPWLLLSFVVDPRTGLGRFDDFGIGTIPLMELLLKHLGEMSVEAILALPDVAQRVDRYREQNSVYREMIRRRASLRGKVLVIDLRPEERIAAGNRFLEYVMFPEATVSVRAMWGFQRQNVVFAVGHSILNRYATVNVGSLMLRYGGGGHPQVGTCQVDADRADQVLAELVEALNREE